MKIINKNTKNKSKDAVTKRLGKLERYVNTHKGDLKYRVTYNAITPAGTGDMYYISPLAQGDDAATRTGNVVNLQRVEINMNLQMTKTCNVRFLVFRDKMNNGVLPTINETFDSTDTIAPLNYLNFHVQKRFVKLHDEIKHFTIGGVLTDTVHIDIPQAVKVRYSGSGGLIGSALSNQIFVAVICDTATAGAIALYTRIFYTDE